MVGGGVRSGVARRVPEVVQTSAMDCGPAVFTSLLRGHGLDAHLERVRDLCGTGVDGTSIDVLTDLAVAFGLRARQLVVPADHLGSAELGLLPAVLVIELPGGLLHFVVVWRRVGRWAEVMDPAVGRRWMPLASLLGDAYRHEMRVPAAAWHEYAETTAFTGPLRANLQASGLPADAAGVLVEAALASQEVGAIALLDAVARRAVRLGLRPNEVRRALVDADWSVLAEDAMAVPDVAGGLVTGDGEAGGGSDEPEVVVRGVVVLSVDGVDRSVEVPADLASEVLVKAPSPAAVLAGLFSRAEVWRFAASVVALFTASVASIGIAFGLEDLVAGDGGSGFGRSLTRVGVVLAVAAALGVVGMWGVVTAGRRAEVALRCRLEERVGRIPDAFFRTRPSSDLVLRAHLMHRLRDLSGSVADLAVGIGQVLAAVVCLLLAAPGAWWAVVVLVVAVVVPSLVVWPAMAVREHRSATIAGALSHVYLGALVGALPVRAHRAARAIEVEHLGLLGGWASAERSRHRLVASSTMVTLLAGYLAAGLVVMVAARSGADDPTAVALVGFLAFVAVNAGSASTQTLRRFAPQWVVAQRLLALSSVELDPAPPAEPSPSASTLPVSIELRGVTVAGDHAPLLSDVSLRIEPGEHVGVVGPSGAGKSTLVAVAMGWVPPDVGDVLVDGAPLTPEAAVGLRRCCGWVDPDVVVWGGTLAENLWPGGRPPVAGWPSWAAQVGVDAVADRVGGLEGLVGEEGRLLSGGEAQRVRLGRLFARPEVRLVVLDEATRGLDPELRRSVLDAVAEHFAGVTTISVTHDLEEALARDRILYVDGGRVLADGPPQVLLADPINQFTRMVRDHEALQASLGRTEGWTTARLDERVLTVDPPPWPAGTSPEVWSTRPADPAGPARPVDEQLAPPRRQRVPRARWMAVLVSAVAVLVGEWTSFLRGWSAMFDQPSGGWWPLMFCGAAVAAGASMWLLGTVAVGVGAWLRRRLLAGALDLDLDRVRRSGSGELNGRILEAEMFEQQLVLGTTDLMVGIAQITGAVAVVVWAGGPAATGALIGAWTAVLVLATTGAVRSRRRWTDERIDRTRLLLERFRGHRTEAVYGPPPHAAGDQLDEYRRRSLHSDRWKTALLSNATVWLPVAVVTTAVASDRGSLLAGLGAVVLAWSGFEVLGTALDDLGSTTAAHGQFKDLLPERAPASVVAPRTVDATTSPENPHGSGQVKATALGYTFPGAQEPLFTDLDLTIEPGDRIVVHGDSGSGKSTLGSILGGVRSPNTGTVQGVDTVVYVPQFGDNHTFQAPLAFNLLMGRRWPPDGPDLDDADDLLATLGLDVVVQRMPRGLGHPVGEAGWQLSHGERGRMYLARALLQQPATVVLDETLEGLDPHTTSMVLATIVERVPAVVLISHH